MFTERNILDTYDAAEENHRKLIKSQITLEEAIEHKSIFIKSLKKQ